MKSLFRFVFCIWIFCQAVCFSGAAWATKSKNTSPTTAKKVSIKKIVPKVTKSPSTKKFGTVSLAQKYKALSQKWRKLKANHDKLQKEWLVLKRKLAKIKRPKKRASQLHLKDATAPIDLKKMEKDTMESIHKNALLRLIGQGKGGGPGARGIGRRYSAFDAAQRWRQKSKDVIFIGRIKAFGSLGLDVARKAITSRKNELRNCYKNALKKTSYIRGQIKVFLIVQSKGKVLTARIQRTTMNSDPVENCIIKLIRPIQYPAPKGGGEVHITYTFYFKKPKKSSTKSRSAPKKRVSAKKTISNKVQPKKRLVKKAKVPTMAEYQSLLQKFQKLQKDHKSLTQKCAEARKKLRSSGK